MRTFGCQMNEHDSERIAGLLEADGLVAATRPRRRRRRRPQHLLHPRERRQQAVRQPRPPEDLEGRTRRSPDRGVGLPGPEGPRHRAPRAAHVDVVMGTHNVHRASRAAGDGARGGPITEILDAAVIDDHALFPSALPAVRETSYNAWVTIQIGCDNTCAFCIVPAVRGVEIVAPVRGHRRRGPRPRRGRVSPRSRCSARTSTATAATCSSRLAATATRSARVRPLFADLLRAAGAVDGIRRVRFTSPHPKDMRPETFAAMAETPAVCPQLHYPLQSGSDRVLAAMHRGYTADRYLRRLAEARRTVPDLAVSTDIIVGFPGETDDDFARHPRGRGRGSLRRRLHVHLLARARAPRRRSMEDRFVDPAVAGERFTRLRVVIERSALAANQARIGRVEEVLVEGPSKKDPGVLAARTAQHRLVHFVPERPLRTGSYATVEITGAAPHHLTGRFVELVAEPSHRLRIPVASL